MENQTDDRQLTNHLIDKYREILGQRYNHTDIDERFGLPSSIGPEMIKEVQEFFMQNMYPPSHEREQVDRAFDSLKRYITDPIKIWGLLGNMAAAIFKFGAQFPSALKAGFNTLHAYMDAKKFEHKMLASCKELGYTEPLTDEQFIECLKGISRDEAERFIQDVEKLFMSLSDTLLLRKTINILKDVTRSMEARPGTYPKEDIDGINLGIGILQNGHTLFKKMDASMKNSVLRIILQNERWFLDQVYGEE